MTIMMMMMMWTPVRLEKVLGRIQKLQLHRVEETLK
jgi:hypothetical protein